MKGVLTVLKVVGVISVAVLAPNALQVFARGHKSLRRFNGTRLNRSINSMQKKRLVDVFHRNGQTLVQLTPKGQRFLQVLNLRHLKIKPQKKWDGRWRLVIFDIPERFKRNRRVFQRALRDIGFVMLQKSVWICPYPCEKEVSLLKDVYQVDSFIKFITAQEVDLKPDFVKRFNLN